MIIKASGDFTQRLWDEAHPIFRKIIKAPFYREMADGTLPRDTFREFLQQDILYLKEDTRAIKITAEKAEIEKERIFFEKLISAGLSFEYELHKELASSFSISEATEMNRACEDYSKHLVISATEKSYAEGVAALLPCYWIYQEAGLYTAENAVNDNPYSSWISAYSSPQYYAYTKEFIEVCEEVASRVNSRQQELMLDEFLKSVYHELNFITSF